MSRDPELRLEDILESIEWIERYLDGYDYAAFVTDRKTIDAVTRCLEVIGEAAKHLPDSLTDQHPEVPWRAICGFRDVLAHSYFRTDNSIIWDAAGVRCQELKAVVQLLLDR
jgi:uncharacterized protein with HEPN domain